MIWKRRQPRRGLWHLLKLSVRLTHMTQSSSFKGKRQGLPWVSQSRRKVKHQQETQVPFCVVESFQTTRLRKSEVKWANPYLYVYFITADGLFDLFLQCCPSSSSSLSPSTALEESVWPSPPSRYDSHPQTDTQYLRAIANVKWSELLLRQRFCFHGFIIR